MRVSVFLGAVAAATVLLSGPVHADEAAQVDDLSFDNQTIEGLFPGHYEAHIIGGYKMMIAAREDGTMMGRAFGREDRGRWEIRENELCVAWLSWTRGKYKCGTITQEGEWYVATNTEDGDKMHFRPVDKHKVYSVQVGRRAAADR